MQLVLLLLGLLFAVGNVYADRYFDLSLPNVKRKVRDNSHGRFEPVGISASETATLSVPSLEDFEEAFEKYLEYMLNEDNWVKAKSLENVVVWRGAQFDYSVPSFMAVLTLTGVPYKAAVKMITDIELRKKFDQQYKEIEELADHGHCKTVYWIHPFAAPCSPRDIVTFNLQKEESVPGEVTYIVGLPGASQKYKLKMHHVRAVLKFSLMRIQPHPQDKSSTLVTTCSQTDMNGLLPQFVVDGGFIGGYYDWANSMVEFFEKVYSKMDHDE